MYCLSDIASVDNDLEVCEGLLTHATQGSYLYSQILAQRCVLNAKLRGFSWRNGFAHVWWSMFTFVKTRMRMLHLVS